MGSYKEWFDRDKLKEIFREHWQSFKDRYARYRSERYEEAVEKMLGCGDPENGFATYICSKCGQEKKKIAFSCKSCFCLSCAKVYTDQWARKIESILFPGVAYRHVVLTIPDELRDYFYRNVGLLSDLMQVGIECLEDTLSTVLRRRVKGGYIVVVQTNGRSGSYNPHLHIIMTSGGLAEGRQGEYWVKLKYLPYEVLHKKWKYFVVDSFPPSPRSKHRMPELQCTCGGDLCYVEDL